MYASIGENITVFAMQGAPYLIDNVNVDTPLGSPAQANRDGIAWSRLSPEVVNLGNLLPENPSIQSGADFDLLYPDALVRMGVVGIPDQIHLF